MIGSARSLLLPEASASGARGAGQPASLASAHLVVGLAHHGVDPLVEQAVAGLLQQQPADAR